MGTFEVGLAGHDVESNVMSGYLYLCRQVFSCIFIVYVKKI